MRAPYCEVCEVEVEPSDDALVRFAAHPSAQATPSRHSVGGDDERGWFCGEHVDRARQLAHRSRSEAVTELRLGAGLDLGVNHPTDEPGLVETRSETPVSRRAVEEQLGRPVHLAMSEHDGEWQLTVPIAAVELSVLLDAFEACLPEILELFDLEPVPLPLPERSWRTYDRIDGCEPPWCPYGDEVMRELVTSQVRVVLHSSANHWSAERVANTSASFTIWWRASGTHERIVVHLRAYSAGEPDGPSVDTLSLPRIDRRHLAAVRLVLELLA